jgi:hypothetical protein
MHVGVGYILLFCNLYLIIISVLLFVSCFVLNFMYHIEIPFYIF